MGGERNGIFLFTLSNQSGQSVVWWEQSLAVSGGRRRFITCYVPATSSTAQSEWNTADMIRLGLLLLTLLLTLLLHLSNAAPEEEAARQALKKSVADLTQMMYTSLASQGNQENFVFSPLRYKYCKVIQSSHWWNLFLAASTKLSPFFTLGPLTTLILMKSSTLSWVDLRPSPYFKRITRGYQSSIKNSHPSKLAIQFG